MKNWNTHFRENFRLSWPIILGQLSLIAFMSTDTLMVGNYSSEALAASGFANGVFFFINSIGMGLAIAVKPPVATSVSSARLRHAGLIFKHGLLLILLKCIIVIGFNELYPEFLLIFEQPDSVLNEALPYFRLLIISMLPWLFHQTAQQFCEAAGYPKLTMYGNLIGNLTNILLNWLLIFGIGPFPEMGIVGAGLATLISRCLMMVFSIGFILYFKKLRLCVLNDTIGKWEFSYIRKLLSLGVPIALQLLFEIGAFSFAAVMAGWVSAPSLAAHQIALNISVITYLVALGLSQGTTVHVASQVGKKSFSEIRRAGFSAVAMVCGFMLTASFLILLFRSEISGFYISADDPHLEEIMSITAVLLLLVALYQLSDGIQVVAIGALRGLEDVRVPTLIALIAYWILGIPLGYVLAFTAGFGVAGIWIGLTLGLTVAALLMSLRFRFLSGKQFDNSMK